MRTETTTFTPCLFDMGGGEPVAERPREGRKALIERAFAAADELMVANYTSVLFEVGSDGHRFGPWEVTAAYERRYGKLSLRSKKALGGLYQLLLARKEIVADGFDKRPNGNLGAVYRVGSEYRITNNE